MISRRKRIVAVLAVFVALPFAAVQACGPDWEPDVFVRTAMPDDLHAFASGQLGILQAGYDSIELAVAYRYLNGGRLSLAERLAYDPPAPPVRDEHNWTPAQIQAAREADEAAEPVIAWRHARALYLPAAPQAAPTLPEDYSISDYYYDPDQQRCPNPAFVSATLTLNSRASTWGKQSPALIDWIRGQDAVFANCTGKTSASPAVVPADSPALLRADRAYQAAAAAFYAGQLDDAHSRFEAIAHDPQSPWHAWGDYLAARTVVRQAFANAPKTDQFSTDLAHFDLPTMRQAQASLAALLHHHDPPLPDSSILAELNFVRMRTEPDKRMAEICAALAGPAPDSNFSQDLKDLNYVLVKRIELKDPPLLLQWIQAFRGGGPAMSAIALWQQTHSQPWLVVSLMHAGSPDSALPDLLSAAASVPPGAPAYDTVAFHRVRLLTALHRDAEARTLVDQILPALRSQPPSSRLNAFLSQRMAVATSFDDFLTYAPRAMLGIGSPGAGNVSWDCNANADAAYLAQKCPIGLNALEFDADSAVVLNRDVPLALLVEAAASPRLPARLRQDLTLAAWTRSVLLGDASATRALAPHLPNAIRKTAGDSTGFPATLALLRNPGLRPYVEPGISHLVSYANLDHFRSNWWCGDWYGQFAQDPWAVPPQSAAFLSKAQQDTASFEYETLLLLPCAPAWLGHRVLDYAKTNPSDPDLPEALALTVRATRYACLVWGASKPDDQQSASTANSAVSKEAFQYLHAHYPQSPWTAKTKYYY